MPTTFVDGPAAGVGLTLRRAPMFLRVVQHAVSGTWDALDQLQDTPAIDETIHVYRLAVPPSGPVHVCVRGARRHESGWITTAVYRIHDEQPDREVLADTERWRAWATAAGNALTRQEA